MTRKRKCDFISKIQLISMKFLADLQTLRVNFNYFTLWIHTKYILNLRRTFILQKLIILIFRHICRLKNNPWRVWYKYPDNGKSKELKYFWKYADQITIYCPIFYPCNLFAVGWEALCPPFCLHCNSLHGFRWGVIASFQKGGGEGHSLFEGGGQPF